MTTSTMFTDIAKQVIEETLPFNPQTGNYEFKGKDAEMESIIKTLRRNFEKFVRLSAGDVTKIQNRCKYTEEEVIALKILLETLIKTPFRKDKEWKTIWTFATNKSVREMMYHYYDEHRERFFCKIYNSKEKPDSKFPNLNAIWDNNCWLECEFMRLTLLGNVNADSRLADIMPPRLIRRMKEFRRTRR